MVPVIARKTGGQFPENTMQQQAENGGEEEATVDVQFTDLPNALIACKVPEDLFNEGSLKVRTKPCFSPL